MENLTTPYVDLDRVLTEIADDAVKAGWTEAELTDAVIALARRLNAANDKRRRLSPAILTHASISKWPYYPIRALGRRLVVEWSDFEN